MGFPRAGRAAPRDFPRAKPESNPKEEPGPSWLFYSDLHYIEIDLLIFLKQQQDKKAETFFERLIKATYDAKKAN